MNTIVKPILCAMIVGLLGACTSHGGITNPVERRLTWFSFISGEDISSACHPGGSEYYRLVYWADRDIQIRIYDMDLSPPARPQLRSRVLAFTERNWLPWSVFEDPDKAFRPVDETVGIDLQTVETIRQELLQAGWSTTPPPVGRKIASHSFAWLISGCRDGQYAFQVWEYPDLEFKNLRFPELLFAKDPTGIKIHAAPNDNERRVFNRFTNRTADNFSEDGKTRYNMLVGNKGVTLVN